MKHCSRTLSKVWTLCIILSLVCVCVSEESTVSKERMHEIVKSMLGFKDIPNMPHPQNVAEDAPQYMMDLYERFKNGSISKGELNGNTVRSIKAKQVTVRGQTMFVFNLTSLVDTEQMISAEIHLYKRRKTRYNKKAELEIMLHEMSKHYSVDSGKITINPKSFGWQWFDVTNSVKSCLSPSFAIPHSLGLNFKMAKPHGHSNMLKLTRFMHHHSVPYLIIYSNDSQDIDLDEIDKIKKKEKEVLLHPEIDTKLDDVDTERTNRDKRSLNDNSADIPSYRTRARSLSILTNEIPEDPDDFRQYHPVDINIQTHPGMLQTRKESRHRLSDARLIPYPEEYVDSRKRRKWRNRRRKNQKGRRKNTLELPKKWEDLQHRSEDTKSKKLCGRKKLVIDFNDIGWGEWIISPKSFKAHYCSGSCPFPLTKNLRPSNHATMLSLVNAFGIYADVPAPCCVPEKLSSITLLYVDENNNVVLKNYPNMTVQKCGCR